ncbi:MAG TPA: patatin-like protein [Nocardioidaceae bacterium]|nr:patatin-like protein [Nocardioidaceae bacterium]
MSISAESGGLASHQKTSSVPREEIRFGVILNGGVSLAVWMGGAVLELDRLTRNSSVYAHLLSLAGCTARADVIAGTSAGGINGAALALSQVNPSAEIASLRDVWVEQGRIESLLRQPFRGAPTSLLRGDEFFLPKLNDALTALAVPSLVRKAEEAPIDLSITTTVLRGNQSVTIDSMGQRLPQREHAARFHWRRPQTSDPADPGNDPFSDSQIARTAHRLALASRCTASFPIAFEPVFVPVDAAGRTPEPEDPDALTDEQRLRPDMAGYVKDWGDETPARDRSRFVMDGGALANTPTKAALQGVESMPASGPVRRVMLLVYPHANAPGPDPADQPSEPPSATGALSGLLGALTAQGSRTFVDELEQHNLRAAGRRGTRSDLLGSLPEGGLELLAATIFEQYRRLRRWRAARDLALRATLAAASAKGAAKGTARRRTGGWNYERVRSAAEKAQQSWVEENQQTHRRPGLPYVPDQMPTEAAPDTSVRWAWGVSGAIGVAEAAAEVLRSLIWVLPGPERLEVSSDYHKVETARLTISQRMNSLRDARSLTDAPWDDNEILRSLQPNETYWHLRLASYDRLMLGNVPDSQVESLIEKVATGEGSRADTVRAELRRELLEDAAAPGSAGEVLRREVVGVLDVLRTALPVLDTWGAITEFKTTAEKDALAGLDRWREALIGDSGDLPDPGRLLTRLLQLEVTSTALGDEVTTGATLPVEVVQLSAQTHNAFMRHTRSGEDKLGGMSVNRFGGFLKRSWRVNDWTWGRLDAATILCRTVLQPARVRRTALLSGYLRTGHSPEERALATVNEVMGHFEELPEGDPRLERLRVEAVEDLVPVFDPKVSSGDLPAALPGLAHLFAWALHLQVVSEEMPALAASIRADRVEGANARSNGEVLLQEQASLLNLLEAAARSGETPKVTDQALALEAFDRAGIGREALEQEASSDLTIRTATTAAAVGATVVDSDRSGLRAAKPVTRALRGGMLLPYWVVNALTSRAVLARGLALLGLAVGAVLLALALFGALPSGVSGPAAALGGSALLVAFGYGALRTGTMLHGLVLLTPVVPLVAYAVERFVRTSAATSGAEEHGVSTLLVVAALAAGLMLLGSLPATTGSVWAALDRLAERGETLAAGSGAKGSQEIGAVSRRSRGLLRWVLRDLLPPLLALALVVALVWLSVEASAGVSTFVREQWWWLGLLALLALAAGGYVASKLGGQLQTLRETRAGTAKSWWSYQAVSHPAGAAAGWSVLYGAGYLVLVVLLVWDPLDWSGSVPGRALLMTSLVLFVVLTLVLPVYLPIHAFRDAGRLEERRARTVPEFVLAPEDSESKVPDTTERGTDPRALAVDLATRGVGYRWFVSDKPGPEAGPPSLTGRGRKLDARIRAARARETRPRD